MLMMTKGRKINKIIEESGANRVSRALRQCRYVRGLVSRVLGFKSDSTFRCSG